MKILVAVSRILVGFLFIISGLIKLNDPVGFSFKLEEYFSPGVLNLDFLTPYALAIAIVLVIFETLLGVMLLLGYKQKFTVWSLLVMIVFFSFLTFYSAYFNKVTDCGCFGDAIKLTPWESFSKDVVLLILILILFFGYKHIKPFPSVRIAHWGSVITLLFCVWFARHVYSHLPSVDFRPYKIGVNIEEGMSMPDDAPQPVFEYAWKFNIDGEEKTITTNGDYPSVDGDFIDVETTEVQKGYEPPIHDFTMEREGVDHTSEIMGWDKVIVIVARDILKANDNGLSKMKSVADQAKEKGYKVIGMSASNKEQLAPFKEKYELDFDFYFCDLTTLKTIVRSNPGVLELNRGTIVKKLHFNDVEKLFND